MTLKLAGAALALVFTAAPVLAQTPPPPPPAEAKTTAMPYVMAAGQSDQFEMQSSQIALQKSTNPATKRYAQMMIKHHTKTTAATTKAAAKAGLAPMAPMLDPRAQASLDELNAASPADFDRIYFGQQVPSHQAALDLNQNYASKGDAAPLRASAKAAVPIVMQHLAAAEKMMRGKNMSRMSGM